MKISPKIISIIFFFFIVITQKLYAAEKIKIGLLVPLSGNDNKIGKSILQSVRLAINKINNSDIEVIPKDTKNDPLQTKLAAQELEMSGVKIGVITHVSLDDEYMANVAFQVFSSIQIPSDSVASIKSDGILGNKYLSISPNNRESKFFMTENQSLENVEDFESIEDQVSRIIFLATQ